MLIRTYSAGFEANERHVHELEAQLSKISDLLAQQQQSAKDVTAVTTVTDM